MLFRSIVQRGTLRQLIEEPADPFVTRFVSAQRQAEGLLDQEAAR